MIIYKVPFYTLIYKATYGLTSEVLGGWGCSGQAACRSKSRITVNNASDCLTNGL